MMPRKYQSFNDYIIKRFRTRPHEIHYYVKETYHDELKYYRHLMALIFEALYPDKKKEYMDVIDFILTAQRDLAVKYPVLEYKNVFLMEYIINMTKARRNRCKFRYKRNFCYYTYQDNKFYGEYKCNNDLTIVEAESINKLKKELRRVIEQIDAALYKDLKNGLEEIIAYK
jgi:hypothetical protein